MRLAGLMLGLFVTLAAVAETADVYDFDSRAEEMRFQTLISELRCPKCQNQNIADSNAPISKDMRGEVYRMMQDGAGNEEIIGALEARFGEFVRYKPKVDQRTIWLWATPAIVVMIGLLAVAGIVLRSRGSGNKTAPLSEDEQRKAEQILSSRDDHS
jgi:cytochrome c-type biogenesis protein CcmH